MLIMFIIKSACLLLEACG